MNCSVWKQAADMVIEPDVNGYKYDDFEHAAHLVKSGELAMRAAIPEIRNWLQPEPAVPQRQPRTSKAIRVSGD
jgi:hypothetical protein